MKKVLLIAASAAGVLFIQSLLNSSPAVAMAKKPATPAEATLSGKRVVQLAPVVDVSIQMPDGMYHDFGGDFAQKLEDVLSQSGRYIVEVPPVQGSVSELGEHAATATPEYAWPGSVVPAASLTITVEGMSFQTGSGGDRMFYGFNERFRTAFNDGFTDTPNEFPLRADSTQANWFDNTFNDRGVVPFDSQSGLDLGDGFQLDVLFAWLSVKYATYHAELQLRMDIDAPLAGISEYRLITVSGEGYFYDVAGAYEGYSAGISVARSDAMGQALGNAISGTYAAIDHAVAGLPLTGRIDAVTADGTILLGTGANAAVVPGTRYELIGNPEVLLQAVVSNSSGTEAQVVQGDPTLAVPGTLVREALAGLAAPIPPQPAEQSQALQALAATSPDQGSGTPAAVESITLPWNNLPQANLTGLAPAVSWLEAFWKSLVEEVFLPYRIWRYTQYDQAYKNAASSVDENGKETLISAALDSSSWSLQARSQAWAKQIGLDQAPDMESANAPVIAVIDSGIDYNHWTLHDHLWLNPSPSDLGATGPADRKDYYGWDFISGDSHPYDDGYHGTEVASLISAVAPVSKIMALKVFNPWGITSSAAIYGAFQYAVDHGAKIIVCGWATHEVSQAIAQGVAYAHDAGVAVIAAAGDNGQSLSQVPSYPALLGASYDNVLAVAGVSSSDQLVQVSGASSNYDSKLVGMSAPGQGIEAATPRSQQTHDTSTGLATAITAGTLARLIAADQGLAAQGPAAWYQVLRAEADSLPSLDAGVAGGLRVRVRH